MRKIMYENNTNTRTNGSPPSIGRTIVVTGQRDKRGGQGGWGRQVFGVALECRRGAGRAGSLASQESAGAKPRLAPRQKERLVRILLRGPRKAGYRNELWTCPRVGEVIQRVFGVKYHPDHVWRILHDQLGWTCQTPEHQVREKDDEAIWRWRKQDWPRIKRGRATAS